MPRKLVVEQPGGSGPSTVELDGVSLVAVVQSRELLGAPFAAVFLDGDAQYDLEIWVNGNLKYRIPPHDSNVEAIYERIRLTAEVFDALPDSSPSLELDWDEVSRRREAVQQEIASHPGTTSSNEWGALGSMINAHHQNRDELVDVLAHLQGDPLLALEMVQNLRPSEIQGAVAREVNQRLHNYLASTATVIDQTRRITGRYLDTYFMDEYELRKNIVTRQPVTAFMRDLRNFLLHRRLPELTHHVSWTQSAGVIHVLNLPTSQLHEWTRWTALAKAYLLQNPDDIDLRSAVSEHAAAFDPLCAWVLEQFRGIHYSDMVAVNELRYEFNWFLSGGQEGRPRRDWAMIAFPYAGRG